MSASESTEFERFGPWVDSVESAEDVPRLFRSAQIDLTSVRAAIKVPRNIERRHATAGMDLYDRLLYVDDTELVVLSRDAHGFSTTRIALVDIVTIDEGANLLDGRLIVHAVGGVALVVPFNGSSRAVVFRFVDLLRSQTAGLPWLSSIPARKPLQRGELGEGGLGIDANLQDALRAEPELRLLAASALHRARSSSAMGTLMDRIRPRSLQPLVVAATARELIVLTRMHSITDASQPDISELRRIVDLHHLRRVAVHPHARYAGISTIVLALGDNSIELDAPAGSEITDLFEGIGERLG